MDGQGYWGTRQELGTCVIGHIICWQELNPNLLSNRNIACCSASPSLAGSAKMN
jgi:hypothetical protein